MSDDNLHIITNRPPWMAALVDQRVALFKDKLGDKGIAKLHDDNTIVVTPLVEPSDDTEAARKIWDETCDGCGKYVPGELYDGSVSEEVGPIVVHMFYGVCGDCRAELIA